MKVNFLKMSGIKQNEKAGSAFNVQAPYLDDDAADYDDDEFEEKYTISGPTPPKNLKASPKRNGAL